ncbi:hypothetical protein EGT07_13320 [Herbaspirillum sp. HC18]|nr:hypothetical protein EGT07_13320 [Herbaspirillum sp. HC18]
MGGPLQNTAIERPEKTFDVEMVMFGTIMGPAVRRTIKVLAQTCKGARRICRSRYRRVEIKSAREAHEPRQAVNLDLFPGN